MTRQNVSWLQQHDIGQHYEALSYTWGDENEKRLITINDQSFYVTESLYQVLFHLRLSNQDRVLWIDAICINQDGDVERGHQVQAMGSIYSSAWEVIVWLGESNEDSHEVISFIKSLLTTVEESTDDEDSIANYLRMMEKTADRSHLRNNHHWHKICLLLQRPW
jgi:hypothetical protein